MLHIPNKKGICAHIFNVRALDAKQRINFFWPYQLSIHSLYSLDTANNCNCGNFPDQAANISHCVRLNGSTQFCFLEGGERARYCPGANPSSSLREMYFTSDENTCARRKRK